MKSFLKYTLATIVGVVIVNLFLFFFFVSLIGTVSVLTSETKIAKPNSILRISLEGEIMDRASNDPFDQFDYLTMSTQKSLGLNTLLTRIKNATYDSNIIGIYLDLTDIQGSYGSLATAEELRKALLNFKKSGKFIYSYSNLGYSQVSYYLGTVADRIFVNPETPLLLTGMSSSISFYKESLEKLGVKAEVVKVGKFKSAVEPFLETEMSKANREQVKKYLDSSWGTLVEAISASRNIPVEKIQTLADNFDIYTSMQLKEWGYFDEVFYEDQMLTFLKEECKNRANSSELHLFDIEDYKYLPELRTNISSDKIAVVYAQGEILVEQSSSSIGIELAETIRELREDDDIKAIVLRVNSPGGSALTSDIIWRETMLAQQKKPLIVSMGNVAASGGYYISCAADTILAEETTLTGSIGIFGLFFSGEELIEDRLGIHTSTVKTNEHSDFGGSYPLPLPFSSRPFTAYERNVMQNFVNQGYETFLSRIMEGRGFSRDSLDAIAQGRVWTGKDALELGLVDMIGGLEDAIQIAVQKAGLTGYQVVEYPSLKNPLEELMLEFTTSIRSRILKEELGSLYPIVSRIKALKQQQGILARMPYDITTQ